MATAEVTTTGSMLRSSEESVALAAQLRRLARVATFVALLTSPAAYFFFHKEEGFGRRQVDPLHRCSSSSASGASSTS